MAQKGTYINYFSLKQKIRTFGHYIFKHFPKFMKKAHIVKHFIKGCTLAQIWYRKPYQFYYSAKFYYVTLYRKPSGLRPLGGAEGKSTDHTYTCGLDLD
jgi:hypothetical protein